MSTKTTDDTYMSEDLYKNVMAKGLEIDEEKYNEKLPYSEVFKNIARTSTMITSFSLLT